MFSKHRATVHSCVVAPNTAPGVAVPIHDAVDLGTYVTTTCWQMAFKGRERGAFVCSSTKVPHFVHREAVVK